MLEIPLAEPTSSFGTHDVATEEAGPFANPMPTAAAINGTTNEPYVHEDSTRASAPKPTAATTKPPAMTLRTPNFVASRVTSGVTTIKPTVAGSVATPAWSAEKSRV